MKKRRYPIIFLSLILFIILTSCTGSQNDKIETDTKDSQLYASLSSYLNYYYSMDLFSYEDIVNGIIEDKDSDYILGRVDAVIKYSPVYLSLAWTAQKNMDEPVMSEDLFKAISNLDRARINHLTLIKHKILDGELNSLDLEKYKKLSKTLRGLNIDVTHLDNEKEYIENLNNCIDIISKLENKKTKQHE